MTSHRCPALAWEITKNRPRNLKEGTNLDRSTILPRHSLTAKFLKQNITISVSMWYVCNDPMRLVGKLLGVLSPVMALEV